MTAEVEAALGSLSERRGFNDKGTNLHIFNPKVPRLGISENTGGKENSVGNTQHLYEKKAQQGAYTCATCSKTSKRGNKIQIAAQ